MSSPRSKFIARITHKKLAGYAWDAMQLASSHDPEHADAIDMLARHVRKLEERVVILERQTYRLGAPQYRKGRHGIYTERVRGRLSRTGK